MAPSVFSSVGWLVVTCTAVVTADFNECLGIEMNRVAQLPSCEDFYVASEIGAAELNGQLHLSKRHAYHPVSLISATAKETHAKEKSIAVLLHLAPMTNCTEQAPEKTEVCTFDMSKVQQYSMLLSRDRELDWNLKAYKHHAITREERAQIAQQFQNGEFYGGELAVGVFNHEDVPADTMSDATGKSFARSPLVVLVVVAFGFASIGLLFHHRRRLSNGYAPVVVLKRKPLQNQPYQRSAQAELRDPQPPAPAASERRDKSVSYQREASQRFAV